MTSYGKIFTLILLLTIISGCAAQYTISHDSVRADNRTSLSALRLGMTEDEVLDVMGHERIDTGTSGATKDIWNSTGIVTNPWRVESRRLSDDSAIVVLYYYTEKRGDDQEVTDDELMPIVIVDNSLVGWGWSFVPENHRMLTTGDTVVIER